MDNLREQIANLIEPVLALNDPPIIARERANRISYSVLSLFKQARYIQLAEDQTPQTCGEPPYELDTFSAYRRGQQDMLKAGWKKIQEA